MNIEYFLINLLGFAIAILLLIIITKLTRDWTTFAHFFSLVWAITLAASQLYYSGLLRPRENTLILLYAVWWIFLFASIIVLLNLSPDSHHEIRIHSTRARIILFILVSLHVLTEYLELRELNFNVIGIEGYLSAFLFLLPTLRFQHAINPVDLPWYLEVFRWGFIYYVPLAVILFARSILSRKMFLFILIIGVSTCFSRYTRAPFIQFLVVLFISWMLVFKPRLTRQFFFGSVVFLLAINVFFSMQKTIASQGPGLRSFDKQIAAYFGGSVKAYESLLLGKYPNLQGLYSLDMINFPLYRLGLIEAHPGLSRDYINSPIVTNVYTYLDTFTLDFGIFGALLGSFILGFFVAWLYTRVRHSNSYSNIVIYAYAVYACVMAPVNNEFIRFGMLLAAIVSIGLGLVIDEPQKNDTIHDSTKIKQINLPELTAN